MSAGNPIDYYPEDIHVKKDSEELNLKSQWRDVNSIFRFENARPYVVLAGSGGGKTNLCYDILMNKAKEATAIYYVSETKASGATSLIKKFPDAICSECTLPNMISIWREIQASKDSYYLAETSKGTTNRSSTNVLASIYLKLINNGKLQEQEKKWKQSLLLAFPKVFDSNSIVTHMSSIIEAIAQNIGEEYYQSKVKDSMTSEQKKAIDDDKINIEEAFQMETFIRLIVNIMETCPNAIRSDVTSSTLTRSEINIINGFYSKKPKTIFIIDDCTDTLQAFAKDNKSKTMNLNGEQVSYSAAYENLMTGILTRARHANCMVVIFTHSLSILSATAKDNISTILVNSKSITEIDRLKSYPKIAKEVIRTMCNKMVENNEQFNYCFLCYDAKDDPKNVYITKADCHDSHSIIEYDDITQRYYKLYDDIKRNNKNVTSDNVKSQLTFESAYKTNDDSDYDSDDDDVI